MIPQTFDAAFERVAQLVQIFRDNEQKYLEPGYQEAEARQDFIDKFLIALGWDVNHEQQTNPYEQEVKVERGVKVGAAGKRADYAFLVANTQTVRFFVEAKKPSVELETPDNCFQTVRYGWNANAPLSVLTDFEELLILDCRYKPDIATATNRVVKKFYYTDYADRERFAEIYYLFGREAVLSGSLEKFAANLSKPTGSGKQAKLFKTFSERIDTTFLLELDEIRARLAASFKQTNPNLDGEALTESTQRTVDRLVFMRFLEDKLIEQNPIIGELASGGAGEAWRNFINRSRELDRVYNGIIFKSHLIDRADFAVDETLFSQVCEELSPKESIYDFNAIPIAILGSIYERFLGKVIVVDEQTGAARIEEKPEVRKAGGVYYTPEYIVNYIVENTVGALVKGKTPAEIASLQFADIACGSGSFLIGVYDYLLRYTTEFYNQKKNQKAAARAGCIITDAGGFRLSLEQRTGILLNNIYGVDVDSQAVEVSQLSLFLKLLEDETTSSARLYQQQKLKLLPTLENNIICGNALIDWDIESGQLFKDKELRKLNPMSYHDKFPEIMRNGGFDAIVGNPPYGMISGEAVKNYVSTKFVSLEGRLDIYELFIEKALSLCKLRGLLGYIVPSPLLSNLYTRKLRKFILENSDIQEITNFKMDVFSDPTVHTCIVTLSRSTNANQKVKIRKQVREPAELHGSFDYEVLQKELGKNANYTFDIFVDPTTLKLIEKLNAKGIALGEICFTRQCIKTGNDDLYVIKSDESPGDEWKKSLQGKSIGRYETHEKNIWLKYGDWLARNWKTKVFTKLPK